MHVSSISACFNFPYTTTYGGISTDKFTKTGFFVVCEIRISLYRDKFINGVNDDNEF